MKKTAKLALPLLFLLTLLVANVFAADDSRPSAQTIIAHSDAVRNPDKPFRLNLRLSEYVDGSLRNEIILRVFSKIDRKSGQFKNLVRYMEPPRDLGKAVLMNGTTMWFYDPASKSSVRISPQQRLVGQASEGDVITVNLAKDYTSKLVGPAEGEALDDADRKPRKCWHVELSPSNDSAIYGKIDFWVEKGSYRPVKGKFYSDSGRLLKIAYYHNYQEQLGVLRPSEMILIDGVNKKLVTTINSSGHHAMDIPDSWYQREFLPHLKVE
ncbi:MAG: outer membrane lipoprotein-sorting protein [Desulfuromonadales bacterium]|nr:outer membrane lipoprotein-sorting protein [Desulfuromonadales bacterium]